MRPTPARRRLMLAASGGGHLRQILELEPFWSLHDSVLVTEDTPLARSLEGRLEICFVPHVAFGQRHTEGWSQLARAMGKSLRAAGPVVRAIVPDLVLTTGAGSALAPALSARRRGAELVVIESFARFEAPSLFGRLMRPFASRLVVQSPALLRRWPKAVLADPFRLVEGERPAKAARAVVTVGTVHPFDRLVQGVAGLKAAGALPETVWAQVGRGGVRPPGMEATDGAPFERMKAELAQSDILFTHGGTGSLVTGLEAGCRIVAMPRDPARGEHYDDHQREIVEAFAARGLIEVAREAGDLEGALARARAAQPRMATTDYSALVELLCRWYPPRLNGGAASPNRERDGPDPRG